MTLVEMCSHLATERAGMGTLHLKQARRSSIPTAHRRKPETDQDGSEATTQRYSGGQGVHREVESEGHEEKYRAVIDGGYLDDEPVGQRWDKVEPAI